MKIKTNCIAMIFIMAVFSSPKAMSGLIDPQERDGGSVLEGNLMEFRLIIPEAFHIQLKNPPNPNIRIISVVGFYKYKTINGTAEGLEDFNPIFGILQFTNRFANFKVGDIKTYVNDDGEGVSEEYFYVQFHDPYIDIYAIKCKGDSSNGSQECVDLPKSTISIENAEASGIIDSMTQLPSTITVKKTILEPTRENQQGN